jgi:hypothetical protein
MDRRRYVRHVTESTRRELDPLEAELLSRDRLTPRRAAKEIGYLILGLGAPALLIAVFLIGASLIGIIIGSVLVVPLIVVTALKGKYGLLLLGFLFPPVWVFSALGEARTGSWWASRF